MIEIVLFSVLYFGGLILFITPTGKLPVVDGDKSSLRLRKHFLALGLFGIGAIGLASLLEPEDGIAFVLSSVFLIVIISVFNIWWEKYRSSS